MTAASRPTDLAATLPEQGVATSARCVNWPGLYPTRHDNAVTLAHTATDLYVLFSINAPELRAMAIKDLDPVARDTCFEIFLRPQGEALYRNFEFNYTGVANVSRRPGRQGAVKFTPTELARIGRMPLSGAERHDNRAADAAVATRLVVKIPLDLIGFAMPLDFPAAMEGNIYMCSDSATRPYYLSWTPIESAAPDFHRPDFFAPIILL